MALTKVPLIAVDFETTGLNSQSDEIISMGFCPIVENHIQLADCTQVLVKPKNQLKKESVAIHRLTDDNVSQGKTAEDALLDFLKLTHGKVIVAHHHSIERKFIQALAIQILGTPIQLNMIDTCIFAKTRMQHRNQVIGSNSLRLFNLRKNYGLPQYNAHSALEDAIATAELLLAQITSLNMPVEDILLSRLGFIHYKN